MLTRLMVAATMVVGTLAFAQPTNDTCANAEVISPNGAWPRLSRAVLLADAGVTSETTIDCQSSTNSSVWYSFTPAVTGAYLIHNCNTASTLSDTALQVYTGDCSAPTPIAPTTTSCNDDGCSFRSMASITLTAGTPYLIQVAKYGSIAPSLTDVMQIAVDRKPENDTCNGTIPALQVNAPYSFSMNPLTTNDSLVGGNLDGGAGTCYTGLGHSTTAANNSGSGRDVVFSFSPPSPGPYTVRLSASRGTSSYNSLLYVTDSCTAAMTPPQTYAPPACLVAANRVGTSTSNGEDVSCFNFMGTGPYFVWADEVSSATNVPTGYEVEVSACFPEAEPNGTPATANSLACPITGSVPAADIDFFSLGAPTAGARVFALVEANTAGTSGSTSTDFDLRVTTDTDTLEYDDANADTLFGGSSGAVAGTPLTGLPAYLRVTNFGGTPTALREPYRLFSVVQPGSPSSEIEPNETVAAASAGPSNYFAGALSSTTDVDVYAFEARAGDWVFASLNAQPDRSDAGTPVNHVLALIDPDGNTVVTTTESSLVFATASTTGALDAGTPNFVSDSLVYRARINGLHYVRLSTTSTTGRGDYNLSISTNCGTGGGIGAPTISAITPATGSVLGNTVVTVTGTNFNVGTQVRIGGALATITARTSTTLTATTPAGNVGAVDVTVTNAGNQTGTLASGFTYFEPILPPTITSVTPNTGPTAGGTSVTIVGTLFKAGAEVTFTVNGTPQPATNVVVVNALRLTATTPAHAAGVAEVTVRNPVDALQGSLASAFTYLAPPTIATVSPTEGLTTGGQTVTITGTDFRAGATVRFGATAGSNVVIDPSGTSLTVTTPSVAANGAVNVVVTNADTQAATATNAFTYRYPAPAITTVTPASGFEVGGTNITLRGTNFVTGATVTVGGVAATGVSFISATEVRAVTPAGTGLVDVALTNVDAQVATAAQAFRYVPAPTLTAIAPAHGPVQGGTRVTLTGTGFLPGAAIFIGGVPAFAVDVTSATSASAITNAGAAGLADVKVTNPDTQAATLTGAYTYDPGPTLASLSPISGTSAGGTSVTIRGTGFLAGATVLFGTDAATTVTVVSPTELTAITPARAVGVVSVVVRNADNQSAELPRAFRFVAPPTLTAVAPATGDVVGGTVVRLTGTGFNAGSTVSFGGAAATQVSLVSGTELDALTPAHAPGAVDVVVTTDGASATLAGSFTFTRSAPTLTAVAPLSGSTAGGTLLTLTGTGFAPGATITVGGTAATNVTVVSPELARAVIPAHAAGAVDVELTNDDAQKATLAGGFTYVTPPTGNTGLVDAGSGAVGADPQPIDNVPGGVSCGCTSFDGSLLSLGGLGLLLLRSRRRRS